MAWCASVCDDEHCCQLVAALHCRRSRKECNIPTYTALSEQNTLRCRTGTKAVLCGQQAASTLGGSLQHRAPSAQGKNCTHTGAATQHHDLHVKPPREAHHFRHCLHGMHVCTTPGCCQFKPAYRPGAGGGAPKGRSIRMSK